jgi:hypothetical protein
VSRITTRALSGLCILFAIAVLGLNVRSHYFWHEVWLTPTPSFEFRITAMDGLLVVDFLQHPYIYNPTLFGVGGIEAHDGFDITELFVFAVNRPDGNRYISIFFPAWVLLIPICSPIWLSKLRNFQGARRIRCHRCAKCGYDIRATPLRCPECGTEISKTAFHRTRYQREVAPSGE